MDLRGTNFFDSTIPTSTVLNAECSDGMTYLIQNKSLIVRMTGLTQKKENISVFFIYLFIYKLVTDLKSNKTSKRNKC